MRMNNRNLQFESEADRDMFANELFNRDTVSKFIESSFNGNVLYLDPLDEKRAMDHFKTSQYVEKICTDRSKIMQKIHKVGYGSIFSRDFKVNAIDKRLGDLEIDEKLMKKRHAQMRRQFAHVLQTGITSTIVSNPVTLSISGRQHTVM